MTSKGDALALAIALSSSEETLLGPTDSQICATALRHYAKVKRRSCLLYLVRTPALVCAILIGASALTYEAPMISVARGASANKAIAFGNTAPIPHLWLRSKEVNAPNTVHQQATDQYGSPIGHRRSPPCFGGPSF